MNPIASYSNTLLCRQVLSSQFYKMNNKMVITPMKIVSRQPFAFFSIVFFLLFFTLSPLYAGSEKEMQGWGVDDDYNKLYSPKELDKLKGTVIKFKKVEPLPGMSKATALVLDEGGDKITVHICPVWFATAKETGIKRGDKVKIKGSWAEINGEDIFMASKIKKGEHYQFKTRLTKDGMPFWTMTPEVLDYERSQE